MLNQEGIRNQLAWCYNMLFKNLNGEDLSSVRISLRNSIRALEGYEVRRGEEMRKAKYDAWHESWKLCNPAAPLPSKINPYTMPPAASKNNGDN